MSKALVTAYSLYLREGPARTFKSIGVLRKDEQVEILGQSADEGWKNLRTTSGLVGWASAKYLQLIEGSDDETPIPPPTSGSGEYKVTAYALYMREGPGTNFKSLGHLGRNEVVTLIAESADGEWKQIRRTDGLVGWASAKYLQAVIPSSPPEDKPDDPPAPPPPPETGIHYQVTAYSLYVRKGPGTSYPALTHLKEGDVVTGLGQSADGSWKQIQLNDGRVGWCSGKYLRMLPNETPPFEPDPDKGQFLVTADLLHFRKSAAKDAESLALLPKDTLVDALDSTPDQLWQKVQLSDGRIGWCASEYLYCLGGIDSLIQNESTATGFHRCLANTLNVYVEANTTSAIVAQLIHEETVNVLKISDDRQWKKVITAHGLLGWCQPTYLVSLGEVAIEKESEEFPWMPIAFSDLGVREAPGAPSNPRILEYMASTNLREYPYLPDETDWCAAFVNWNVEQAGIESTGWATVYPWMAWGDEIKTPRRGCVVTFQWDDGGQHVAFYLGECGDHIRALGGNQSNAVWIKSYPKRNVVNYRIPKNWNTP